MIVAAGGDKRDRAGVLDLLCVGVNLLVQAWRNTQRKRPQKCDANRSADQCYATRGRLSFHRRREFQT
jgi:hypothetical protein